MRIRLAIFISGLVASLSAFAIPVPAAETPAASLPLSAHASISATLGLDSPQYYVRPAIHGYRSDIPSQKLSVRFSSRGVKVAEGAAWWRMSLRGYGYGEGGQPVQAGTARVSGNRIEYQRGPLTEWYVNGPAGLEQGFTIASPPGERRGQPLTLALTLSGNLQARASEQAGELELTNRGRQTHWRYTGLAAHDAAGKELRSWFDLRGHQLLVRVDDAGAQYPLTIDPILQVARLTRSGGAAGDAWGYSVSMNTNTIVVGWPNALVGVNQNQGAVYVFVMPSKGWGNMTQTAELTASDGAAGDGLGASVAMSGNTVVAGAPLATVGQDQNQGAAYVFVQPPGGWVGMTENAKLTATDGVPLSELGFSSAITLNTIVLGAPYQVGALYVYVEPTGGWTGNLTQTAELTASGIDAFGLGSSVSIYSSTIAAGAQDSTVGSNFEQGAVYVYTEPTGGWISATQNAELIASDGNTFDHLGYSIVVSEGTVIAGAPNAEVNGNFDQGAAYVFTQPAGGWANMTQTAKLTASDGAVGDSFGSSVALFANFVFLCGAPGATINSNVSQGAVYVYLKPGAAWQTTSTFFSKETVIPGLADAEFGTGVALNSKTGVAAAPGATVGSHVFQGAVYVFQQR